MSQQPRPLFFEVPLSTGGRHIFPLNALSRVDVFGEGPSRIVRVFCPGAPSLELMGEDAQAFVEALEAARHSS